MKVFVKTLKETYIEIDVNLKDKVADVKKHLESVFGSDVYQAALHMLIHNGKVLKDGTTLQQNKVSENSFMVIKNKSFSATQVAPPPGPQPPSSTTNSPSNNPYNQAPPQPPQPAAPPTGPNANPWNLFPQRFPAGDVDGFLESLLNDPGFHAFRSTVQANPHILRPLYQDLRRQYPQPHMRRPFLDLITRLINDPFAEVGYVLGV